MTILTPFLVDRIYPIEPRGASDAGGFNPPRVAARVKDRVVATQRDLPGGGSLTVLGFRPRDDQSASLGYEARWWFEILDQLGAYPPTGRFAGINDNTEYLSRTTPYLVCRFPNGAIALAPHLRDLEESWPGGFARDPEKDKAIVAGLKLTSQHISLKDFKVAGRSVTYEGEQLLAFRADDQGVPIAFSGTASREITIDGRTTQFADQPLGVVAWAPVASARRVEHGAVMQILVYGAGELRIPVTPPAFPVELVREGAAPGSRGQIVPSRIEGGLLVFTAVPGRMYLAPRAPDR